MGYSGFIDELEAAHNNFLEENQVNVINLFRNSHFRDF